MVQYSTAHMSTGGLVTLGLRLKTIPPLMVFLMCAVATQFLGAAGAQFVNIRREIHFAGSYLLATNGCMVVTNNVTEQHPKVGTRMLTEPIQASYAASRYIPPPLKSASSVRTVRHRPADPQSLLRFDPEITTVCSGRLHTTPGSVP
jgi:hypothetical protein